MTMMWKKYGPTARHSKGNNIGSPVLVETTYEGSIDALPTVDEAKIMHAYGTSPVEQLHTPTHAQQNWEPARPVVKEDQSRPNRPISEVPTASSVYTQPSPEIGSDEEARVAPLFAGRERQPSPAVAAATAAISPANRQSKLPPRKPIPIPGSRVPVLRKQFEGNSNPPVRSHFAEKAARAGVPGLGIRPNVREQWKGMSGRSAQMTPIVDTPTAPRGARVFSENDADHVRAADSNKPQLTLSTGILDGDHPLREKTSTSTAMISPATGTGSASPGTVSPVSDRMTSPPMPQTREMQQTPEIPKKDSVPPQHLEQISETPQQPPTPEPELEPNFAFKTPPLEQVPEETPSPPEQGRSPEQRTEIQKGHQAPPTSRFSWTTRATEEEVPSTPGTRRSFETGSSPQATPPQARQSPGSQNPSSNPALAHPQPISRFSWTTTNTDWTYQHSPPQPPPPQQQQPAEPQPQPQPAVSAQQISRLERNTPSPAPPSPSSIMNRGRPIRPSGANSPAPSIITLDTTSPVLVNNDNNIPTPPSGLAQQPPISATPTGNPTIVKRKPTPSMLTATTATPTSPPLRESMAKDLPLAPPALDSVDLITSLQASLDELSNRRRNLQTLIDSLAVQPSSNPIVEDLAARRARRERREGFEVELAEVRRTEHQCGLRLHRAWKRRDQEKPTALWVRRVTD